VHFCKIQKSKTKQISLPAASREQGLMIPPRRMIYDVVHPVRVADGG